MPTIAELIDQVKRDFVEVEGRAAPMTPGRMSEELRTYFARFYPDIDARFALPAELVEYIALLPRELRRGGDYGFYLYGTDAVASGTWIDCNLWAEEHTPDLCPWVSVGHWSDRHDFLVCCDPSSALFGSVRECNDTHPWFNQDVWHAWPNLAAFLEWLVEDDDG